MPPTHPFVSVVVPCRNEKRYIADCLQSILRNGYPLDRLEVLVADGRSDDGTRPILDDIAREHPEVRVLDNPRRVTPVALNLAIHAARGEIIVRMDAHVIYPVGYILGLVRGLEETGADNVGAVLHTLPMDDTAEARAIALALAHPFGVGNSHFRIGTSTRRAVDTVAFFCCRRPLFDRIGLFDEELIRHQDGEFNARIIKSGGRIVLLPEVTAGYYARGTLRQVARMYYQYGYFKPLVARKIGRVMSARQLAPPAFVSMLAGAAVAAPWSAAAAWLLLLLGGGYTAAVAVFAARALPRLGARGSVALAAVFPALHFSYGWGFLRRIIEMATTRRSRTADAVAIPLSR